MLDPARQVTQLQRQVGQLEAQLDRRANVVSQLADELAAARHDAFCAKQRLRSYLHSPQARTL